MSSCQTLISCLHNRTAFLNSFITNYLIPLHHNSSEDFLRISFFDQKMNPRKSIKLKAAILLMVFAVNTMIFFACFVGIAMGFNRTHHADEQKRTSHDGKQLHESTTHATAHKHSGVKSHNHSSDLAGDDQKHPVQKDNCCNDISVELQKLDKSANHSSNPVIKVPFFIAFLTTFSGLELRGPLSPLSNKAIIPQYYPPPDKRIIIQSFQI